MPIVVSGIAAVTPAFRHDVGAKERVLLLELGRRRQALDVREHALDARSALLEATELRLQAEIDHLAALQARINALEKSSKERREGDWQGLVKVYEAMKPGDAATIFNVLDMHVLLQVLDRMKVRKAAAVLAGMQPERARLATQMLAEMRQRRDLLIPVASNN
ncbi:MotE family protein [Lichenicoccus sp.]|uniref:MotE family protein n=1 Tax=Lichenicoccus sp. TaxID=2781899 RepID=UPI003D10AC37